MEIGNENIVNRVGDRNRLIGYILWLIGEKSFE